ncbi:CPBP family intramembrane glutamic endopeptidase [Marinobacter koreensis]|uniref:CPBP family intramembrane glutamic endopeptidase n=1 Tax=Marinobacter koreensis TaxID=335974 RepID=UPI00360A9696
MAGSWRSGGASVWRARRRRHLPGVAVNHPDTRVVSRQPGSSDAGAVQLCPQFSLAGPGRPVRAGRCRRGTAVPGAAQGWLVQHTGPWTAVIAASVLFGLVHYVSFTYFLVATGLGLVLGTGYQLSGSLGLVMLWHALYDMLALYCLLRFPHWFGVKVPGRR